jgi:hypothetical protein
VSLGGICGGDKFLVHNILFKFAIDSSGLFDWNDSSAAKVAGHELKGASAYFNLQLGISVPLCIHSFIVIVVQLYFYTLSDVTCLCSYIQSLVHSLIIGIQLCLCVNVLMKREP